MKKKIGLLWNALPTQGKIGVGFVLGVGAMIVLSKVMGILFG